MTAIGDTLPPFVVETVDAAAMRDWAVFLRDPNPIHLDPEAVRAKGLGDRLINQGPANIAYVMNMLTAAFPGATLASLESRFVDNVFAGERVVATGTVTGIVDNIVTCTIGLAADGSRPVITGTATLRLP